MILSVGLVDIDPFNSQYDIRNYLLEQNNFNNKQHYQIIFRIHLRFLAIAIGPSPEMAKIVTDFDLGLISKDFEAKNLAETVNSFTTDKIIYYKEKSDLAAKELNAQNSYKKLHDLFISMF